MLKQKLQFKTKFRLAAIIAVGMLLMSSAYGISKVRADQYDNQIKILQQQNAANQAFSNQLAVQANSYQSAVDALQSQVDGLQQVIVATQNKIGDLNNQITVAQAQLDQEKKTLGENIKAMYLEGDVSTLEILASSKNLSQYVDRQQYRNAVQDKVKMTLDKINALKAQLIQQQDEQKSLLKDQQNQQAQLQSSENQQSQLLSYTEGQKAAYDSQIKTANAQINDLRAQQAAAERAAFSGSASATGGIVVYKNLTGQVLCGGGYNFYCDSTQDSHTDQWGEYNRECVSYTAWYEGNVLGHYVPAFGYMSPPQGNAYQWGGVVARTPSARTIYGNNVSSGADVVGDVVYMPIGGLGHVGVVLSDAGDGYVHVGQYNLYDEGMYSEMDLKITSNLQFYQFN